MIRSEDEMQELVIEALRQLGGAGERNAIKARVCEIGGFTDEELGRPSPKPDMNRVEYDVGWVLSWLKTDGAVSNPDRGIWSLEEQGN